ncbi:hypothetical protein BO86DRAFT_396109 [Aspergillus japonicus CBS 114.51]|uniref:Uncharacterized protein n=2 Tax=Aspergillus TaxID=5052 RepID=A0A2V5HI99_ASPV1|nr:hypothetical protein BO86DRAFT_396109 [Aspergillus japonicus CBS 114.51]PYI24125.1 hypothetical protein BO99DRAFT_428391 [Aspergillus violaceofuscus CBS 115571]RAH85822.1 hypothetical protein BO86DRAFT_396109 [Aspergillus japonicus CBS 114.51]
MANQPIEVEDRPVENTADIASPNDEQQEEELANSDIALFIVKWRGDNWALGLQQREAGVLLRPSGGRGFTKRFFRTGLERNLEAELVLVDRLPESRLTVLVAHIRQVLLNPALIKRNSVVRVLAVIGRLTLMGIVTGRIYETIAQEYMLPDDFEEEVSEPLAVEPDELPALPLAVASMFDEEEGLCYAGC